MITNVRLRQIIASLRKDIKGQTGAWALGYRDALRDVLSQANYAQQEKQNDD